MNAFSELLPLELAANPRLPLPRERRGARGSGDGAATSSTVRVLIDDDDVAFLDAAKRALVGSGVAFEVATLLCGRSSERSQARVMSDKTAVMTKASFVLPALGVNESRRPVNARSRTAEPPAVLA